MLLLTLILIIILKSVHPNDKKHNFSLSSLVSNHVDSFGFAFPEVPQTLSVSNLFVPREVNH